MLDKIEKLENTINSALSKMFSFIWRLLKALFHKCVPKGLSLWIKHRLKRSQDDKRSFIIAQKSRGRIALEKLKTRKDQFFDTLQSLQKYPIKEKFVEKLKAIKTFCLETPPKTHWNNFKVFLKKTIKVIREKLFMTNTIYTQISIGTLILLIVGSIMTYLAGHKIYLGEFPDRMPANVQDYDYRPDYRFYEKKTLKVLNVKVPILLEAIENIDSITIDFSIRASTRFARYYLTENEYKLRDYFFTTVEPIVSDFPIEKEGKEVLKEKIKTEINNFLYENGVEGSVEEVHILYIVGS